MIPTPIVFCTIIVVAILLAVAVGRALVSTIKVSPDETQIYHTTKATENYLATHPYCLQLFINKCTDNKCSFEPVIVCPHNGYFNITGAK